jgi:hypothetical protein
LLADTTKLAGEESLNAMEDKTIGGRDAGTNEKKHNHSLKGIAGNGGVATNTKGTSSTVKKTSKVFEANQPRRLRKQRGLD